MLRKLVFLVLILALPGCIASQEQLFSDGLDFGDEFGFFTLNADDPEEGFLLVKNDQDNSYEMFGVDDGYSSVFINQLSSQFMVLSGYSAESGEFHHLVLRQQGDQYFLFNDGENELDARLEDEKKRLRQENDYRNYAYRVRDRSHLEGLAQAFANAVETGFFQESEVELVRSGSEGAADRLKALRKNIEDQQES
ncbi:hypothetical protein [Pararhizobium sp. IMCC21322]|uniref:hypothetical protein n=1 Tax=Pararhizobium sp. IMCC21322 TaxID=3067903 RepID=UPI0027406576|nr:hypothetical protein [Pararhizobium sp. IMCC21322]